MTAPVAKVADLTLPADLLPVPPERVAAARESAKDGGLDQDWHALAHAFAAARGAALADRPDRWYARAVFEVAEIAGLEIRAKAAS